MKRPGSRLSPDEVLERAREAEERPLPEIHPQLGVPASNEADDPIEEVRAALGDGLPVFQAPAPRAHQRPLSVYCDSCGHVDDHAHDCPRRVALELQAEAERDEALERAELADSRSEESIGKLARRLGGAIFRRIARAIDP